MSDESLGGRERLGRQRLCDTIAVAPLGVEVGADPADAPGAGPLADVFPWAAPARPAWSSAVAEPDESLLIPAVLERCTICIAMF